MPSWFFHSCYSFIHSLDIIFSWRGNIRILSVEGGIIVGRRSVERREKWQTSWRPISILPLGANMGVYHRTIRAYIIFYIHECIACDNKGPIIVLIPVVYAVESWLRCQSALVIYLFTKGDWYQKGCQSAKLGMVAMVDVVCCYLARTSRAVIGVPTRGSDLFGIFFSSWT